MTDITKQLEDMRNDIKHISHEIVRLTATTEQQLMDRRDNSTKLDNLHTEFSHLKGGLSFLKAVVGILSASVIAFCTWIVTNSNDQDQQIIKLHGQVVLLENKVNDLQTQKVKEDTHAKTK